MKEQCTNIYSLSKTIGFSLLPVGKTEENFNKKKMLQNDKDRAEDYKKAKEYMDRYYRKFIDDVLCNVSLDPYELDTYVNLYNTSNKSDDDKKAMKSLESNFRKFISDKLKEHKDYKNILDKNMIKTVLPGYLTDPAEQKIANTFSNFTTYFTGFFTNRENMFSSEEKSTAISYRCVNDNLPKFIDNSRCFEKASNQLVNEIVQLDADFKKMYGYKAEDVFSTARSKFPLAQKEITMYNNYVGGYTDSNGIKVKGLNEYINLFNQQNKGCRLPLLKPLFKQILSDKKSISFIPEAFQNDDEVLKTVNDFYITSVTGAECVIKKITAMISNIASYNQDGVFVLNGAAITDLSKAVYGDWSVITANWELDYDSNHFSKKKTEKYFEDRKKAYKGIASFSLDELQKLGGKSANICDYYKTRIIALKANVDSAYIKSKILLSNPYNVAQRLAKNDAAIELIKTLLDCIKEMERMVKPLLGSGKEDHRDDAFYGELQPLYEELKNIDDLYNKVRNYITKKPYSKEKIKLNFNHYQLLDGWDINKEQDCLGTILRKDEKYYLAVIDKENKKVFENCPHAGGCGYEKMIYKQIPNTAKYFSIKQIGPHNPPTNIQTYLQPGFDKKKMSSAQLAELIDYVKNEFIPNYDKLHDANGKCYFDFSQVKPANQYKSWKEFCDDLQRCAYSVDFIKVPELYINQMVDKGWIYLFQIYNKDFSAHSKGKPNLHTLYFKMLFDDRNLKNIVYTLNGGAEIFYRESSISAAEKIVHPKNVPIENKNPNNGKEKSTFNYDLIKDRRFTERQFSLHIPITLNVNAVGKNLNEIVLDSLRNSDKCNVIGIDRGERNLVYVSVVNEKQEILEQKSFNIIESDNKHIVDYHGLLEIREKERDNAKKSWKTIGNIKELKEGYISQIVHEISELIVKYDAVIALEDLNGGFINSRKKIDKQIYQKFENALITKLNYLTKKDDTNVTEAGCLLNAYQFTNELSKQKKSDKQNGIVFYVPAWLTSKIDPITGFVNLLRPKYTSVDASKEFFEKFDDIRFNAAEDLFEFQLNYTNFAYCDADYKKKWTVCTNGERIRTYRNKSNNNMWSYETIMLTDGFKKLFGCYGINYKNNLKQQILAQTNRGFFEGLIGLLKLALQMRNSITGTNVDYLISPVRNADGEFYDSRNYNCSDKLPCDADANGAYNIARKALWAVQNIKTSNNKPKLSISNAEWLKFAQK